MLGNFDQMLDIVYKLLEKSSEVVDMFSSSEESLLSWFSIWDGTYNFNTVWG